jgi:hypothetical protein
VTAAAEAEEVVAEAAAAVAAAGVVAVAVEVAGAIRGRGKTTGGTSQTMNFRQRHLRSESINIHSALSASLSAWTRSLPSHPRARTHTHTHTHSHACAHMLCDEPHTQHTAQPAFTWSVTRL